MDWTSGEHLSLGPTIITDCVPISSVVGWCACDRALICTGSVITAVIDCIHHHHRTLPPQTFVSLQWMHSTICQHCHQIRPIRLVNGTDTINTDLHAQCHCRGPTQLNCPLQVSITARLALFGLVTANWAWLPF